MAKGHRAKVLAAWATAEPETFYVPRKATLPLSSTPASPSSPSAKEMPNSRFETLPRELLLDILAHVLPTDESINVSSALAKSRFHQANKWDTNSTKLSRRRERDKKPAAILRVCREFNICGAEILWGRNTFVFDDMRDLNSFVKKVSQETKETIRSLSIGKGYHTSRRGVPHEQWPPAMNRLESFPNLKNLTLWMGWKKPATLEQISMGDLRMDEHCVATNAEKWEVRKEDVVPFGSRGLQEKVSLRLPKRFLEVVDTILKERRFESREDMGDVLERVGYFWLQQIPMPVLQRLKSLKMKELVSAYPLRWQEGATESLHDVKLLCNEPVASLEVVKQQLAIALSKKTL